VEAPAVLSVRANYVPATKRPEAAPEIEPLTYA
jgi:hypothetical protein